MDIPRPENKRRKRVKQLVIGSVTAVVLVAITVGLSQLEPAAPSVDGDTLWIQPVTQGEMLRQVRGPGTLESRDIRWISARSAGRVERIVVRPGAAVEPDMIIVELSNPDLMRQAEEARYTLEAGKATLTELELNLKNQQLDQRAAVATARAAYEGARLQAEAERASTTVAALTVRRSELLAEQLKTSLEVAQERLDQFAATMAAQVAARRAQLAGSQNAYERVLDQVQALEVRAGIAGVLQQVEVEEGGQVQLGANIARVMRPDELQAELKVAETQVRDVQRGQIVAIDTRGGVVAGVVTRIDPAVVEGTVQVDVELTGALPRGARPDQSVDGTIDLERIPNAVQTGRATNSQQNSTISLFKVVDDGRYAVRVPVQIGRTSVNSIEILQGLVPGDRVILSDTSAFEDNDRIRLN